MRNFLYPVSKPKLGALERAYLNAAFMSGQITQGPMVQTFEEMLQGVFGREQHVIACSSGTAALHLALAAAGVGPGDEVLVPSMTYIATANAVAYTGATPVLVDVDPETWTIDVADCMRKSSNKTVGVIPVHIYGIPADMASLNALCDEFGWWLIEDAAEALKSFVGQRQCGTLGDMACFSFYGNKLITTGEGGCVVTADTGMANRLRMYRGQGQGEKRFFHEVTGFNYRMTDLQAAVGVAQLSQLDEFIAERKLVVDAYDDAFESAIDNGLIRLQSGTGAFTRSPWLYTFLLKDETTRDAVMQKLADQAIETRPTFVPLHRQPAYHRIDTQFAVSSKIGDCGMSLPTYAGLGADCATHIAETMLAALRPHRRLALA